MLFKKTSKDTGDRLPKKGGKKAGRALIWALCVSFLVVALLIPTSPVLATECPPGYNFAGWVPNGTSVPAGWVTIPDTTGWGFGLCSPVETSTPTEKTPEPTKTPDPTETSTPDPTNTPTPEPTDDDEECEPEEGDVCKTPTGTATPTEPPTKTATPTVLPAKTATPQPEAAVQGDCNHGAQRYGDGSAEDPFVYRYGSEVCSPQTTPEPELEGFGGGGDSTPVCDDCPATRQEETLLPNSVMAVWSCQDPINCVSSVTVVGDIPFILNHLDGRQEYSNQSLGLDGFFYYTLEGVDPSGDWYVTDDVGNRISPQKFISCSVSLGFWQVDSQGRVTLMPGNTQEDVATWLVAQGYFPAENNQAARGGGTSAAEFARQLSELGPGGSLYLPGYDPVVDSNEGSGNGPF